METTQEKLESLVARLGITLQSSAPSAGVEKPRNKESKPWPHIAYTMTLSRKGREIYSGPYRLGVGHVKIPAKGFFAGVSLTEREKTVFQTLQRSPHPTWKDASSYEVEASLCAKLATKQKVAPKLLDVLHSLLSDGGAHFDSQSFTEWCDDFGYNADSIRDRETWETCCDIGRKLGRSFTAAELAELREAFSEY